MKQLICEMCGSTDLVKQDGVFVCQACGTKYSVEEARKMMLIEGTVEITQGEAEKERLLNNAQTNIRLQRYTEAKELFDTITSEYPDDYRGWWGLYSLPIQVLIESPICFELNLDGEDSKDFLIETLKLILNSANYFKYAAELSDISDLCKELWDKLRKVLPSKYTSKHYKSKYAMEAGKSIQHALMICDSRRLDRCWLDFRDEICNDYYTQLINGTAFLCRVLLPYDGDFYYYADSSFPKELDLRYHHASNQTLSKIVDEGCRNAGVKILNDNYYSRLGLITKIDDSEKERWKRTTPYGFKALMLFGRSVVIRERDDDGDYKHTNIFKLRDLWSDKDIDDLRQEGDAMQKAHWREWKKCQYCGGDFHYGLFSTKCNKCGRKKDY